MFTSETKSPDYSGFWFFLSTCFYGFFLAIVALAMHPNQEHPYSLAVRVHFRVLDFDFGRGLFMLFLTMQMVEVHSNGEVIYAIIVIVISVIDMLQGFLEFKENLQAIGNEEPQEIGNADESHDDEAAGKYDFVGKDEDSSRA